jgi:hypothetical protein
VGTVLDDLTGRAVATARVLLLDSAANAVARGESDETGRVILVAPGPGVFRIYADRLGYDEMISDTFSLQGTGAVELEVRLAPLPVELDPLFVTALRRRTKLERQGFYRRQENSVGYFFDQTDLDKWKPTLVSTLLRHVPGVHVMRSRYGGTALLSRRPHGWRGECLMKIVLDGWPLGSGGLEDLDAWVSPYEVLGIEVYPGAGGVGAPVQHRGPDASCGIVMVWTR